MLQEEVKSPREVVLSIMVILLRVLFCYCLNCCSMPPDFLRDTEEEFAVLYLQLYMPVSHKQLNYLIT